MGLLALHRRSKMEASNMANLITATRNQNWHSCSPRWVSWHSTGEHNIVLNMDDSSIENLGRSSFGSWFVGFSGSSGVTKILHVELMSLLKGLLLAWDLGIGDLVCYFDSMFATQLIGNPSNRFHSYATIIKSIKDLLHRDWSVKVLLREGNAAIDFMAKHGAHQNARWKSIETLKS